MPRKPLRVLATTLLAIVLAQAAHATIINASSGTTADLQGLEWLSLDVTVNMSRSQVENSALIQNGGWRYATRAETGTLINSLWDGVYDGFSPTNAPGALDFLAHWGTLFTPAGVGYVDPRGANFFFGDDGECGGVNTTCVGQVRHFANSPHTWQVTNVLTGQAESPYVPGSGPVGAFFESFGGDFGLSNANAATFHTTRNGSSGSLLVRTAQVAVPAPAVLSLVMLGWLLAAPGRRFWCC
ncbi:MAG: hypothetical protein AB7Q81_12370 [Gammaproteobacteria bacterium]